MAYVVLVAMPLIPLMFTWAPRVPSRNSRLTYSGDPSRPSPAGSFAAIWSKYSASSRSVPTARCTSLPGRGETKTSGSTRVVVTWAASTTVAGSTPSWMRNTSESKDAPSWRARAAVTTPDSRISRPSGSRRVVATTSSSWRCCPSATATQKSIGVASSVPSTRPTGGSSRPDGLIGVDCVIACRSCHGDATPPRTAFEADDLTVVRGFVAAGLGVALPAGSASPGRRSAETAARSEP